MLSRAEDTIELARRDYTPRAYGFLTPYERGVLLKNIGVGNDIRIVYDGGYKDAERAMMICYPEYTEESVDDFISVLKITGRDIGKLNHRDYLGSLMGLGIKRDNIGDILLGNDATYVFVKSDISEYIITNTDKIGRCGVHLEKCKCSEAELCSPEIKEKRSTVQSLRLDAVTATAFSLARSETTELIKQGNVSVDWEVCESASKQLRENDLISVRGKGRARLCKIDGLSAKGRVKVVIGRYE